MTGYRPAVAASDLHKVVKLTFSTASHTTFVPPNGPLPTLLFTTLLPLNLNGKWRFPTQHHVLVYTKGHGVMKLRDSNRVSQHFCEAEI